MARKPIYVQPRQRNPKKPAEGVLQVRRENGKPIPAAGAWVEPNKYIRRRMRDGDLVEARPPKEASAKPAAKSTNTQAEE